MPAIQFTILGSTGLRVGQSVVGLGPTKQRGVLALLLYDANRPIPIDTLVGELWHDKTFEQVRTTLHALISRLRGALAKAGVPAVIERDGNAYRICVDPEMVDLHRFRVLVDRAYQAAAQSGHSAARALLVEAITLWKGIPIADVTGPWSDHCREQLEVFDLLPAYHALFDSLLELGEYAEVLAKASTLARSHEFSEIFALQRMKAMRGLGRSSEALAFYNRFRRNLVEEFGTDPGSDLRALHMQLLRESVVADTSGEEAAIAAAPLQLPRAAPHFVGRGALLDKLDMILDVDGPERVVILHGMPGVGKSSLAAQWINRHKRRFVDGQLFVDLRGFGPATPMEPENALAVLLTSVGVSSEEIPATRDQRQVRLREALGGKRVALLLDNVRNSAQVSPLLAAAPNCVILITSRVWLRGLMRDLQAIKVPPLSQEESIELLVSELGASRAGKEHKALGTLAGLTAGLPLGLRIVTQRVNDRPHTTLSELAHELQRQSGLGVLGRAQDKDEIASLSAAFSWSYSALPPDAARTFRLLGLHPGTDFSLAAACALLGDNESEVERNLRALARVNLLQPGSGRRYRQHDLLHSYAADLVERAEPLDDRQEALRRLMDWYALSMSAGYRRLMPDGTAIPSPSRSSDVTPMTFGNEAEVIAWLTAEASNLTLATHWPRV